MKYFLLTLFLIVGCSSTPYYQTHVLRLTDGGFIRVMDCKDYMDDCTVLVGRNHMSGCKNPVILLDEEEYSRGRLTPRYLYC
jgi:hypothetical protein